MLEKISVIGFDLDGTLYPITPEIRNVQRGKIYANISEFFGIPAERAKELFEKHYEITDSGTRSMDEIAKELGTVPPERHFIQEALEQADFLYLIKTNPQLDEMLARISKTRRIDLITGSTRYFASKKLAKLGIPKERFTSLLCHEDGSKSNKDIYLKWLANTKQPPSQHLYVGDQPKLDIDVPRSLGIRTCIVGCYGVADAQIKDILELERVLV